MRNVPLGVIRGMVKRETSKSPSTFSTAQDGEINQIIYDMQGTLAGTYDWPFLKTRWSTAVPAGLSGRYTVFPTVNDLGTTIGINLERPILFLTKWNQVWQEVEYGIDEYPEFNYLDSDRGQVLDPIQRWQFSDEAKFEVWPLPASAATVRFIGQRLLTDIRTSVGPPPVWNDALTLDLDDLLVAYFSAAEYLTRQKSANAATTQGKAAKRLADIRAGYPVRTKPCIIGRGQTFGLKAIRQIPMVLVGGK